MAGTRFGWALTAGVTAALVAAGCGGSSTKTTSSAASVAGGATSAAATSAPTKKDKVTLQLKWVAQGQFAGYYAAKAKGYYDQAGLDVTLKPGGPDITPEQVVAGGQAQFGIDWLPSLLATRDKGGDLVNIAQVFAKSGMTELSYKDSGITDVAAMRSKKVGVWCCGNENELYAAIVKNGMDPKKDVKIVNQPFDMNLFIQHQIDTAAAMTYNEVAQVLETPNPKTGKLFTLADLNVITMEQAGTAMLEDGIFTTGSYLKDAKNQDVAKRFLAASFKGWVYCRDNADDCLKIVLSNGTTLGEGHQKWQVNEINALIWPNPTGIGIMDQAAFTRTADIAKQFKVIAKPATNDAYRTDLAEAAVADLKKQGVDVNGSSWTKSTVAVTAGGK